MAKNKWNSSGIGNHHIDLGDRGANSRVDGNDKTQILNINDTKNRYDGKEDNADGQVNHYNIE